MCLSSQVVLLYPMQPVEEDVAPLFNGSNMNFWMLKSLKFYSFLTLSVNNSQNTKCKQ